MFVTRCLYKILHTGWQKYKYIVSQAITNFVNHIYATANILQPKFGLSKLWYFRLIPSPIFRIKVCRCAAMVLRAGQPSSWTWSGTIYALFFLEQYSRRRPTAARRRRVTFACSPAPISGYQSGYYSASTASAADGGGGGAAVRDDLLVYLLPKLGT